MIHIVAGIVSLVQYLQLLKDDPESYRPEFCPHCAKAGLWHHGFRYRKADRDNNNCTSSLNPIPILRFYCPACEHTCSVLPECIPPRRWYLWCVQQLVIIKLLSGISVNTTSHTYSPSRSTCRRWWYRLKEEFLGHAHALRSFFSELGQCQSINEFWPACLEKISFARAMLLCHQHGVVIP